MTTRSIAHYPLPITHYPVRRAVFLDRDGVINRCEVRTGKPYAPRRLDDFRLLPGVAAALHALKRAGFVLIVVTNQPDIGNGLVEFSWSGVAPQTTVTSCSGNYTGCSNGACV